MNEKNAVFILLSLVLPEIHSQAQGDTVRQLKGVSIEASKVSQFTAGIKVIQIDSTAIFQFKNRSLADLLVGESPITIKSYGAGSLATTSFRGGSASQTAILWNGFNINSISNGQLDLSLVPIGSSTNITIQCGGVGALWGSGAMGGAIHLNSSPEFNTGLNIDYGIFGGSFHTLGQNLTLKYGNNRISSSLAYINNYAGNDFNYTTIDRDGKSIIQTQQNSANRGVGILNNNHFLISKNQQFSLSIWLQQNSRNVPPTLLENQSFKKQEDQSQRISADWQLIYKKTTTHVRVGAFRDVLNYKDSLSGINDTSLSTSLVGEVETKWTINPQHSFNFGINYSFMRAETSGYPWSPERNSTSLFASYQYQSKHKRLIISNTARQEFIINQEIPFTYSTGAIYHFTNYLSAKANISKVYRIPTFNDLYWNPGGNPNLLPEDGFSEEIGLQLIKSIKKVSINHEITYFNRDVNNWIMWLPSASFWAPQNILSVWSRGLETQTKIAYNLKKLSFQLAFNTNYILSTNQKASSANDQSVKKQLIYVPMYSGGARFLVNYKYLSLTYRHQYTGYRYISTDHSSYLTPYDLGSVRVDAKKEFSKYQLSGFFAIENLWNKSYQIMSNRAMPLRYYHIGIAINYKQKSS